MIDNLKHGDQGGKWIRRVFVADNSQLVLHDQTGGIVLANGALTAAHIGGDVDFKANVNVANDDETSPVRMVAHIGGTRDSVIEHLFVPSSPPVQRKTIILQVSSQSAVSEHSTENNSVVWLSMMDRTAYKQVAKWLSEFLSLIFNDAQELARAGSREKVPNALEAKYPHLLDIIMPRTIGHQLALRVLGEAFILNGGQSEKPHGDILVRAPVTPDDWVAPFVEGFKDADNDKKKMLIEAKKGMIADEMGDNREKVKAFYDKLNRNSPTGLTLEAVEQLVEALRSAVAK